MDILIKKMMETTWGKSLLYSLFAGFAGAVSWLAIENKRLNEARAYEQKEYRREVLDTERRCATEIEALNQRHLEFLNAALQRMQKIEERQKKRR